MASQTLHAGKVVVITGSSRGLGLEMGRRFTAAGATVVLTDVNAEQGQRAAEDLRAQGGRARFEELDVRVPDQSTALVDRLVEDLGAIDIWVNNAGVAHKAAAEALPADQWSETIDVMLSGAFYCSRAVAKHMVDRGRGKIVSLASGFGFRGGRDNYMYACGKGGVIQLTRTLATSLSRYGITATGIAPGYIPTEGTAESNETLPRGEFIPMGRVGYPHEMGPIAVFLASSASDYMNGETIVIDGGGLAGGFAPTGYAPEIALEVP